MQTLQEEIYKAKGFDANIQGVAEGTHLKHSSITPRMEVRLAETSKAPKKGGLT